MYTPFTRMAYNSDQQQRLCKARQAVSRLQTLLGGTSNDFELPGIVVVGPQSVGKSALLESICGIRLPSALGICTRCPLQLVMYHDTTKRSITLSYEHKGLQTTPEIDESDISKEVERVTKILTGNTNKIIDSVITLEIRSPTAPNLTVMDLPGVQGSSPADFPEDTKAVIDGLVTKACQGKSRSFATHVGWTCRFLLRNDTAALYTEDHGML